MRYVLDTSWLIQLLAGHYETVTFHKRIPLEQMAVSYITVGEIYDVAFTYANPQAHVSSFRHFLAPFALLNLNESIMERLAEIRCSLRPGGKLISDFDLLIAATALPYDLTLLTYNTRHFKRVPDLK